MSNAAPLQTVASKPLQNGGGASRFLQRKCACGTGASGLTGECKECGKKKLMGLQTKLRVNESGDTYEREADRVAEQVLAQPAHPDVGSAPPRIQRFSGQSSGQIGAAPASVDRVLSSPGRPLEPTLRQDMEQRFGHDFSRVRVHSGGAAEQSAQEVNARAYTVGHDIVFGAGWFAPGTHQGQRLIAHELTHVMQQAGGGIREPVVQRSPDRASDQSKLTKKPRRKIVKMTVSVDQDRIVYDFEEGPSEERAVTQWNVRDPVPGTYRFTEKGEWDDWKPSAPWVWRQNLIDPHLHQVWIVDNPPPRQINDEFEVQIVGGAAGQEVESLYQARKAMDPEIQELLFSEQALPIRSGEDQYIAYQMMRDVERYGITPTELLTYQNEHPETRRAESYAEVRKEFNAFLAQTVARRETGSEQMDRYLEAYGALAGEEESYKKATEPLQYAPFMRGRFTEIAELYRESGEPEKAAQLERAQKYAEEFEAVALDTGRDLLTSLQSVLRVDKRYIAAHDTPAYRRAQWASMHKNLQAARGFADPLYDEARKHGREAAIRRAFPSIDIGGSEFSVQELEALATKEKGDADAYVAQAIPNLRAAPRFKDFPYKSLVQAEDADAIAAIVTHFVEGKSVAVVAAREHLLKRPDQIYRLDTLVAYVKQKIGADQDPIFDQVLRDRAAAIEARESWIDDLLMLLSIALSFVPGVGLVALTARAVALGADVMAFNRALDAYNQQAIAFNAGLSSEAPSPVGVYLAALGPVASGASLAGDIAKAAAGGADVAKTAARSAREVQSGAETALETAADVRPPSGQASIPPAELPITEPVPLGTIKPAGEAPTTAAPTSHAVEPSKPPPSHVPPEAGRPPEPRLGGATAEGSGEAFTHEIYPQTPMPTPEYRKGGVREESRVIGEGAPAKSTATGTTREDLQDVLDEASGGTVTGSRSPGDPSHLTEVDPKQLRELRTRPEPQRPTPVLELPESVEAAKAAGVPDEVYGGGTVFTRENFPELIPDRPLPRGKAAPDIQPPGQELERGVAGRRPTSAPDPSHLHHTELQGDVELIRRNIEAAGGRIDEVAINRTQRAGTAADPTRVSAATRPDLQLAVIDGQLNGRRIVIEYDKAPGTRAMAHARGVLAKDPDAIVILKIVGFEPRQIRVP